MTKGNPLSQLLLFVYPLIIGDLLQQLYNLTDIWTLGNFTDSIAFSAVGSCAIIVKLVSKFTIGFTNGAGIMIGQFYGSGDRKKVCQASSMILVTFSAFSFVLTGVILLLIPFLMKIVAVPQELWAYAGQYLYIVIGFTFFSVIYNTCAAIMRAVGNSKSPSVFLMISTVVNIVLDLLLVAVFGMGIKGVALATVTAQGVAAILSIVKLLWYEDYLEIDPKLKEFDLKLLKQTLRIGFPTAMQYSLTQVSNMFVISYINSLSIGFIGGYTVYYKLQQFMMLCINSFGVAAGTAVSQNVGARQYERGKKYTEMSIKTSLAVAGALAVIFALFARPIVTVFNSDTEVVRAGMLCLQAICPFCVVQCFSDIYMSSMRGYGDTRTPFILSTTSHIVVRQIYLYIISRIFPGNEFLIMFSYPLTWVLGSVLLMIAYRRMLKKLNLSYCL